uniref:Ig-like domain-containing protein n=1 Tax=Denticeps clupeoides TaxID=299321 RepID=A0AAY4CG02_9TELE
TLFAICADLSETTSSLLLSVAVYSLRGPDNIVSCPRRNLSGVPAELPRHAAVLDLSYNSIARLRAEWSPVKLPRLRSLVLSHNGLGFLSSEAFVQVARLRHLDLSSNVLRLLDELVFQPLKQLEVLLLYNNRISQIDRSAFAGLAGLQKVYLSQNLLSRFPLELVKEKVRPKKFVLLDVSSNRMKSVPLPELQALPAHVRNSLYFHDNPLSCSCGLYGLLARWHVRGLSSASDFRAEHVCYPAGQKKAGPWAVFQLDRLLNCSAVTVMDEEAYLDDFLVLRCDSKLRDTSKTWVTPQGNGTGVVLPDGSLQVGPLRVEDTGVYTCFAVGESLNETIYVSVKVHNFTQGEASPHMNTGYTTLAGCLASVVLVLVYLYLTPCRCPCCRRLGRDAGVPSSAASASPAREERRRVAFADPKDPLGRNGRLGPDREEGREEPARSSVSSDTPIVV